MRKPPSMPPLPPILQLNVACAALYSQSGPNIERNNEIEQLKAKFNLSAKIDSFVESKLKEVQSQERVQVINFCCLLCSQPGHFVKDCPQNIHSQNSYGRDNIQNYRGKESYNIYREF